MKKTLKERYNLKEQYDIVTGLTEWYNNLIYKTEEELTVKDIEKMIRQNILKELAVKNV